MEKPVFVVLRKYFFVVNGIDTPFTPDGGDIKLFNSIEDANAHALEWCGHYSSKVDTLCDWGIKSAAECQYDDLVLQCVGRECHDKGLVRVSVEVYQKYVL